jgi:hypothetical protein
MPCTRRKALETSLCHIKVRGKCVFIQPGSLALLIAARLFTSRSGRKALSRPLYSRHTEESQRKSRKGDRGEWPVRPRPRNNAAFGLLDFREFLLPTQGSKGKGLRLPHTAGNGRFPSGRPHGGRHDGGIHSRLRRFSRRCPCAAAWGRMPSCGQLRAARLGFHLPVSAGGMQLSACHNSRTATLLALHGR